ncbi:MAG: hypothetical protein METHP_01290 [Methanoregula sp. SKADARSKE-2]|nr:MAG: hypothetical protein METHP_01290 [Methanoregula sp. SKADARSKE-2]
MDLRLPNRFLSTSPLSLGDEVLCAVKIMPKTSIAMLERDHHIHLIPAERILMMSL